MLGIDTAGSEFQSLRQWVGGNEVFNWDTGGNFADGNWHHALLRVNQNSNPRTIELFLNGVSYGIKNLNGDEGYNMPNGALKYIGQGWLGEDDITWRGKIDEVMVFDRYLKDSEVQTLRLIGYI